MCTGFLLHDVSCFQCYITSTNIGIWHTVNIAQGQDLPYKKPKTSCDKKKPYTCCHLNVMLYGSGFGKF